MTKLLRASPIESQNEMFFIVWCDGIKEVVSKDNVNVKNNNDLGHCFPTRKKDRDRE